MAASWSDVSDAAKCAKNIEKCLDFLDQACAGLAKKSLRCVKDMEPLSDPNLQKLCGMNSGASSQADESQKKNKAPPKSTGLLVKTFRLVRKKQPQPRLNQPTDVNVATILPEYPLVETQRPNETPPKPAGIPVKLRRHMKNKQPHEPVDVRTAVNGSALSDKWFPDGSQTKNEVLPKSTGTKCLVQKTSGLPVKLRRPMKKKQPQPELNVQTSFSGSLTLNERLPEGNQTQNGASPKRTDSSNTAPIRNIKISLKKIHNANQDKPQISKRTDKNVTEPSVSAYINKQTTESSGDPCIQLKNNSVYSVNIDADNLNEDKEKTEKEIILNKQSGVLLSEKAEESYFQAKPSSSNVSEVSKSKNEAKNGVLCKFESYNIKLSENVNENDFQNEVFTSNASDLHYDTDEIQNGIIWGCNNPDTASGSENREEKNLQIESFIGGSTDVERNEENKRHDARGSYGECPTVLLPEDIEKDLSTRSLSK